MSKIKEYRRKEKNGYIRSWFGTYKLTLNTPEEKRVYNAFLKACSEAHSTVRDELVKFMRRRSLAAGTFKVSKQLALFSRTKNKKHTAIKLDRGTK